MPQGVLIVNYCYLLNISSYITESETTLNKNSSMFCGWFVDKKLSVLFGEDNK